MSKTSLVSLCKRDLVDIYNHAIDVIKPDILIKNAFSIKGSVLTVKGHTNQEAEVRVDLRDHNLHVIGGGKSVLGMACGLAEIANQTDVTHLFSNGSLSVPIGLRSNLQDPNSNVQHLLSSIDVKCLFGSENNLPDMDSVLASKSILDNIKCACDKDREEKRRPLFIVLISGGGSACLTSPKYIDLDEKLEIIRFLVQKGANIVELNKVRRYFSRIKGGQLAEHIFESHPNAQVLSLILSDVIGDHIEYIASGPTFVDDPERTKGHNQLMFDVLNKYGYNKLSYLQSTCHDVVKKPAVGVIQEAVINRVIGNNMIALVAAMDRAKVLGYKVECVGNDLQGFSEQIVEKISRFGDQVFDTTNEKVLIVGGGEATINKLEGETWGKGGRAQEMALDYMISRMLKETSSTKSSVDVFMAGGTDGQDGPTDVAACLASYAEWLGDGETMLCLEEARQAKSCHDSYNFWNKHKPDWLIKTGLTGTNVMDLYMYLISNK